MFCRKKNYNTRKPRKKISAIVFSIHAYLPYVRNAPKSNTFALIQHRYPRSREITLQPLIACTVNEHHAATAPLPIPKPTIINRAGA